MDKGALMGPKGSVSQRQHAVRVAYLLGAMADTCADAVSARVTSSNHDHRLVLRATPQAQSATIHKVTKPVASQHQRSHC